MKITFDAAVDAVNIAFKKGKVYKTLEVAKEVYLDLDKNGKPLYLEIIGAREKLGGDFYTATFKISPLGIFHKERRIVSAPAAN